MAVNCNLSEEIFTDVTVTCDVTEGFEEEAIFFLRKDIDFANLKNAEAAASAESLSNVYLVDASTATTDTKINKVGTKGALVMQLKNAFSGTTSAFEEGDNRNTITNTVTFNVWSSDPEASKQLDAMLNGTFVAILKQKYKGNEDNAGYVGGAVYRMYGVSGSGLKCTGMDNDPYSDSISNGWTITMEETGAIHSMKFLQARADATGTASEEITEAYFQSLKTARTNN